MVNAEGTSTGTFAAVSYTFGGGATVTQGQTSNQSVLAAKTQPPVKPNMQFGAMLAVSFGSFIFSMIGLSNIAELPGWLKTLLVLIAAGALKIGAYMFERKRLQPLEAEYEKKILWRGNEIGFVCGAEMRVAELPPLEILPRSRKHRQKFSQKERMRFDERRVLSHLQGGRASFINRSESV